MLVESGKATTAQYMSNTMPIPSDKPEIATSTAMAGEMLGHKLLYLDAGSGAQKPVSESIISAVKENTRVPLIVGGGMKTSAQIAQTCRAGADIVVVGNKIEESPELIADFASTIHSF
ncbi:MAG: geranylgeranylglyceryl/heptaprenylglyceryl phosphate synthase [Bacteroidales bacterium]|nr:geranylgeranylglyceryl/heptaprenylglyceryl phosphate synthase [Bacteroidales bacterium]